MKKAARIPKTPLMVGKAQMPGDEVFTWQCPDDRDYVCTHVGLDLIADANAADRYTEVTAERAGEGSIHLSLSRVAFTANAQVEITHAVVGGDWHSTGSSVVAGAVMIPMSKAVIPRGWTVKFKVRGGLTGDQVLNLTMRFVPL